jgi:hypothetical protein
VLLDNAALQLLTRYIGILEKQRILYHGALFIRTFGNRMVCRNVPPTISVPEASMQLTIYASRPDLPGTLRAGGCSPS